MPLILLGLLVIVVTVAYFYLNGMMKPNSESKKKEKEDPSKIIYLNKEDWKENTSDDNANDDDRS